MPLEIVLRTSLNYYLIAFDAEGNGREESGVLLSQQLLNVLSSEPITDVFLMSHGWMGNIPAARQQYNDWIGAMAANQDDLERIKQARPGFRPLLIGPHWPSKPWGDKKQCVYRKKRVRLTKRSGRSTWMRSDKRKPIALNCSRLWSRRPPVSSAH
jgi:hypothetical protein